MSQLDATGDLGTTLPDGRTIFMVRVHGRISAFENRCPHQGVDLDGGTDTFLEGGRELIQCSRHGALFLPENGECVFGPCQGRMLTSLPISIDGAGNIRLSSQ
ncbi:Rieske (2Fe-2S) protein [Litchfieldella anticariensis]|uniref:Rieske (2Fe-2S) protein n=1 Tax=Litchfieldella anticariensis TaxID=258591 RepID=UPI0035305162